jgi:uncharacterized membrane protein (DUF4010 family)
MGRAALRGNPLGSARGEIVAGAVGGLVSSTAVTVTNARRSRDEEPVRALAAGAIAAGSVSFLRTGLLVGTLAPALLPALLPAILAGAAVMAAYAGILARRSGREHAEQAPKNPFELDSVIKMALLLVAVGFLARAASQLFGDRGLLAVAALSGLADVDAATVTVTGMMGSLSLAVAAWAIAIALLSNVLAKAAYATAFGSNPFRAHLWLASLGAIAAAGALLVLLRP